MAPATKSSISGAFATVLSARAADIPLAIELTLRYNDSPEDVKLRVLRSVWKKVVFR